MQYRFAVAVLVVVAFAPAVAPGTTAASPSATDANGTQLAPGLTRGGLTDPLALARAHQRVLDNTSYTLTDDSTLQYRNGTLLGTWTSTTSVAAGVAFAGRNYGAFRNGTGPFAVRHYARHVWSNGSLSLVAHRSGDGPVEYARRDGPSLRRQRPDARWETIYAVFSSVNATVVGSVERDGTTLYRVVATGVQPDSAYADAPSFTLSALVSERGVVRRLSFAHSTTFDGQPAFVTRTIRVTRVGNTAVGRPAWFDAALQNTTGGGG